MNRTLFMEQVIIVVQEFRGGTHPEYDLFDQSWTQVGTARRGGSMARKILGHLNDDVKPGPLEVRDMTGTLLLSARQHFERSRPVVLLQDGAGGEVGKAVRMRGILKPEFDLVHGDRRIGAVKAADRRQRVVNVVDEAGRAVAEVVTMTEDTPVRHPTGTDGYYVKLHHDPPEPLRTLVIGFGIVLQSAIGSESIGETAVTFPGLPALVDRLRRRPASQQQEPVASTGDRDDIR